MLLTEMQKQASTAIKAICKASQISKTSQISNTYSFQIKFFHLFRASISADMNWDSLMGVDGIESLQDLLDKSCTSDNNSQVSGPSRNYIKLCGSLLQPKSSKRLVYMYLLKKCTSNPVDQYLFEVMDKDTRPMNRGVFRILSNIYKIKVFAKIRNGLQLFTIFAKFFSSSQMFDTPLYGLIISFLLTLSGFLSHLVNNLNSA